MFVKMQVAFLALVIKYALTRFTFDWNNMENEENEIKNGTFLLEKVIFETSWIINDSSTNAIIDTVYNESLQTTTTPKEIVSTEAFLFNKIAPITEITKSGITCVSDESIVSTLMRSYDKLKIPSSDSPLIVDIKIGVQEIAAISDSTSDFQISVFIHEEWYDSGLRFDWMFPCNNNITFINELLDLPWKPNTCFINSKQSKIIKSPFTNAKMVVHSNGHIFTSYRMNLVGPCDMDLTVFPMDTVRCFLIFESFNYNNEEVHMKWSTPFPVYLDSKERKKHFEAAGNSLPEYLHMSTVKSSDFYLVSFNTTAVAYDYPAGYWDELTVTFYFRRCIGWYMLQAYFPTYLAIFISWISFYLGTGMAARTMLGVNTLLALTFQFGNIIKNLPRVSYVKAIDVWMLSCMTFVFCNLLELTLIGYITAQKQIKKISSSVTEFCTSKCQNERPFFYRIPALSSIIESIKQMSAERIDRISAFTFPMTFFLFNIVYWIFYTYWLAES
ncbi:Ligand-gated ion channel 50 [Trichinella zimbabwensis]|uniref:Ligand-gated ion channel 50 n=1 Tax=Trichinella zimbabwensis TaxID=268475 RepID=A0A0V1I2L7_9BILA|nr:Ligand-gated ion channel 50 [Trichinella zimbabwensis]